MNESNVNASAQQWQGTERMDLGRRRFLSIKTVLGGNDPLTETLRISESGASLFLLRLNFLSEIYKIDQTFQET